MIEENTENILAFPIPVPSKNYQMTTPVEIKVKEYKNQVLIDFEQTLSWVAFSPDAALIIAEDLKKHALKILKKGDL